MIDGIGATKLVLESLFVPRRINIFVEITKKNVYFDF